MPTRPSRLGFVIRRSCIVAIVGGWLACACQAPTTTPAAGPTQTESPPPPAQKPAFKSLLPATANERVETFRTHLSQFFHSLPPPEVLETPVPCPPNLALTNPNVSPPIVDARLLRFFVAGRPAIVIENNQVVPEPSLDGIVDLNSPLFIRLLAVLRERAVKTASTLPHKPNNTPASLIPGIEALEAADRLFVLVGNAQIAGRDRDQQTGGRYTGYLVASVWSTKRGLCFVPISASVAEGSDPVAIERELVSKTQQAVNQAVGKILPGQVLYTNSPHP